MQELKLNVSTDEFLRAERGFTYADLCTMLENEYTLAWLTPHVAIGRGGAVLDSLKQLNGSYCFHLHAEDIKIHALACSSEHLSEICDVVLRLMAASVVHSPLLSNWNCFPHHVSINAASVEYLMEQCQSLKVLTLQDLEIDEDQIRLLEEFSRPGLEIELKPCGTSSGPPAVSPALSRDEFASAAHSCHPKKSSKCVPCQGSGTSPSCCSYQCKQDVDAFIRESGSCVSVGDCDDHCGCKPLNAYYGYCCRYVKSCFYPRYLLLPLFKLLL
jgi:hypothetical protein